MRYCASSGTSRESNGQSPRSGVPAVAAGDRDAGADQEAGAAGGADQRCEAAGECYGVRNLGRSPRLCVSIRAPAWGAIRITFDVAYVPVADGTPRLLHEKSLPP